MCVQLLSLQGVTAAPPKGQPQINSAMHVISTPNKRAKEGAKAFTAYAGEQGAVQLSIITGGWPQEEEEATASTCNASP